MTKKEEILKTLLRSYGHRYYKIAQTEKQDYDKADEEFIPKIVKLFTIFGIKSVCEFKGRCEFKIDDGSCDADNNGECAKQTVL